MRSSWMDDYVGPTVPSAGALLGVSPAALKNLVTLHLTGFRLGVGMMRLPAAQVSKTNPGAALIWICPEGGERPCYKESADTKLKAVIISFSTAE